MPSTPPRQVILLMTDTTRWDMVGCYGNAAMHTPNLDAMAARGLRYERAYTCQPLCGPARSALFTGVYPHLNGGWTNSVSIYDNMKTLGQRLSDADIHAAYIGKWHVDGGDYFGLGRCPEGWDAAYWYDMRNYLLELTPEERRLSRRADASPVPEAFTFAHRVTKRALEFIERHRNEDFFLVVSYDEPHDPYLCPEPYASMFQDYAFPKAPNVWDTLEHKPAHQRVWAAQRPKPDRDGLTINPAGLLGCNAFADAQMGKVLDAAQAHAPDAMTIYTSDHGDMLDSHCLWAKGPAAYDEITRVPLIITGGAVGVNTSPVSHIDLAPTILAHFGLPCPKLLQGRALQPTLADASAAVNAHIYIEFTRYEIDHDGFGGFQPMRAAFDGRWKLVVNLMTQDELYDMQADPNEMENRIADTSCAAPRDALHDALLDWMNETRDPFRGYYWRNRPWRQDAPPPAWPDTGYTRQRENEEYEPRQLDYDTGLEMVEAVRLKDVRSATDSK